MSSNNKDAAAAEESLPPKKRRLRRAAGEGPAEKKPFAGGDGGEASGASRSGGDKGGDDDSWLEAMDLPASSVEGLPDSVSFVRKAKRFVAQLTQVYPKGSPVFSTFAIVVRTFQSQGGDALDTISQLRELLNDQPELLREFVNLLPTCLHTPNADAAPAPPPNQPISISSGSQA